jgi:CheY-like chemotaxis protein
MTSAKPNKPRVAIVDDNVDCRELLAVLLDETFEIVSLDSVDEAIKTIPVCKPVLVLCDLLMPDHDGFDLIKRLRAQAVAIPVIAVSAHVMKGASEKALAAGFDGFIAKPFDVESMLQLIHRCAGLEPRA